MTKGRLRGLGWFAIGLGFVASQGCHMPRGVPEPPSATAEPCPAKRPPAPYKFTGWPPHGLMLDDGSYGAASSWTHEGRPPAGDRCTFPPPGIRADVPDNSPGK